MKPGTLFTMSVIGLLIGLCLITFIGVASIDPRINQPKPPVINVTKITVKTVNGDVIHDQIYEVMIVDDTVDPALVQHAILLTPNIFGFVIVPNDEDWYFFDVNGVPFPYQDRTVLILDRDDYDFFKNRVAGYTVAPTGKIVIGVGDNWTAKYLSDVLTHECTHNVEIVARLDLIEEKENRAALSNWIWLNGYGVYPDAFRGWSHLYDTFAIDEYLSVTTREAA